MSIFNKITSFNKILLSKTLNCSTKALHRNKVPGTSPLLAVLRARELLAESGGGDVCHGNTAHTTTSVTESPRLFAMVTAKHRAFVMGSPTLETLHGLHIEYLEESI